MVDYSNVPAPPGETQSVRFARSRADITALGDSLGEMLPGPVRDAPRSPAPPDAQPGAETGAGES